MKCGSKMGVSIVALCFVLLETFIRSSSAGYCTESYTVTKECSRQSKYYTKCGFLNWESCTRYRTHYYKCYDRRHRQKCCAGYTGSSCSQAICSPSCLYENRCIKPNICSCGDGYVAPRCDDKNECSTNNGDCQQNCTNTIGSFSCSCDTGYRLTPNLKNCTDINECLTNNGGCQHKCNNSPGSFSCSCNQGYRISNRTKCQDINECHEGTALCNQDCVNTLGSYTCVCLDGYQLSDNGYTCKDENECEQNPFPCDQVCTNTNGSFTCGCSEGYVLVNGTCQDINECDANNGGCSEICVNTNGSFACDCPTGYKLNTDKSSCIDKDECEDTTSGCDQGCINTEGSYLCNCSLGYMLLENNHTCQDIDDCIGVHCHNNGSCVDGLSQYSCLCLLGFTGEFCETDIDECSVLNGGCQQNCVNTFGSYYCTCDEPHHIHENGRLCVGAFEIHGIENGMLPRGDYMVDSDAANVPPTLRFSSTSRWYRDRSNNGTVFSDGIVFVESDGLHLPVSMTGIEIETPANNIKVAPRTVRYPREHSILLNETRGSNPKQYNLSNSDLSVFAATNSFGNSFFRGLQNVIPFWATVSFPLGLNVALQQQVTYIVYGYEIESKFPDCKQAPVILNRLYNVFIMSTSVIVQLFDSSATMSLGSPNDKFCFITDLLGQNSGSFFFIFPRESSRPLLSLPQFQPVSKGSSQITVTNVQGIGLTMNNGIKVVADGPLEVWNGDHQFTYPLFKTADFWFSGRVQVYENDIEASVFVSMPNPLDLFTDLFSDKWEIYFNIKNVYVSDSNWVLIGGFVLSVGGDNERETCGVNADPAGLYGRIQVKDNTIKEGPLQIYSEADAYVFISSGPYSSGTDISHQSFISSLNTSFQTILNQLNEMQQIIEVNAQNINESVGTNVNSFINSLNMQTTRNASYMVAEAYKSINVLQRDLKSLLSSVGDDVYNEINSLKENISFEINKIRQHLNSVVSNSITGLTESIASFDGIGLQLIGSVEIKIDRLPINFLIGVRIDGMESIHLGLCGRFDIYNLMEGQYAKRFYFEVDFAVAIGEFFQIGLGSGIGWAIDESGNYVMRTSCIFNPFRNTLFSAKVDLFIGNGGITTSFESGFFGLFYIQMDISLSFKNMKLMMHGRFVTPENRDVASEYINKRSDRDTDDNFSNRLMESLEEQLDEISGNAKKRVNLAKLDVFNQEKEFEKFKQTLERQRAIFQSADKLLQEASSILESKKKELENAKSKFKDAQDLVNTAKSKVDSLCSIKTCRRICIPGIEIGMWYCRYTSCMISIDDPFCVTGNILCAAVRKSAFLALEAVGAALEAPLLALDAAKLAIDSANFGLDAARTGVQLAEKSVDVAQLAVDSVSNGLNLVKKALENIQALVEFGIDILGYIFQYGLSNIVEVKNCEFTVETERHILPIFDVSCEVNPFKSGWRTLRIEINFFDPIQSLWQAAKQLIENIFKIIGFRKKRSDLSQQYMFYMHPLIRHLRDVNGTDDDLFDLSNDTSEFKNGYYIDDNTNYERRVATYSKKCNEFSNIISFIAESFHHLLAVTKDFAETIREIKSTGSPLAGLNESSLRESTISNLDMNVTAAMTEFNMEEEEVYMIINVTTDEIGNSSYVADILSLHTNYTMQIDEQVGSIEQFNFVHEWVVSFHEKLWSYFTAEECADLMDCLQFSFYQLNALYAKEEDLPEHDMAITLIDILETQFLDLINSSKSTIYKMQDTAKDLIHYVDDLSNITSFCYEAPMVRTTFQNQSAVHNRTIAFNCNSTGSGHLEYNWLINGSAIENETSVMLTLPNITQSSSGEYKCVVTNAIASYTSDAAFLTVLAQCPPGTKEENGFCVKCVIGTFQDKHGQDRCIQCPDGTSADTRGSTKCNGAEDDESNELLTNKIMMMAVGAGLAVFVLVFTVVIAISCWKKRRGRQNASSLEEKEYNVGCSNQCSEKCPCSSCQLKSWVNK